MNQTYNIKWHQKIEWEGMIWFCGFCFLALINPDASHFSFCPLFHLDIYCPGCGLGRSVSYLFHGAWSESFRTHPLGIVAVIILGIRTGTLVTQTFKNFK